MKQLHPSSIRVMNNNVDTNGDSTVESLDDRISNAQKTIMQDMFGDDDLFDDSDLTAVEPTTIAPKSSRALRRPPPPLIDGDDSCYITEAVLPQTTRPNKSLVALGALERMMAGVSEDDEEEEEDEEEDDDDEDGSDEDSLDQATPEIVLPEATRPTPPAGGRTAIRANVEEIIRKPESSKSLINKRDRDRENEHMKRRPSLGRSRSPMSPPPTAPRSSRSPLASGSPVGSPQRSSHSDSRSPKSMSPALADRIMRRQQQVGMDPSEEKGAQGNLSGDNPNSMGTIPRVRVNSPALPDQLSAVSGHKSTSGGRAEMRRRRKAEANELGMSEHRGVRSNPSQAHATVSGDPRSFSPPPPPASTPPRSPRSRRSALSVSSPPNNGGIAGSHGRRAARHSSSDLSECDDEPMPAPSNRCYRHQSMPEVRHSANSSHPSSSDHDTTEKRSSSGSRGSKRGQLSEDRDKNGTRPVSQRKDGRPNSSERRKEAPAVSERRRDRSPTLLDQSSAEHGSSSGRGQSHRSSKQPTNEDSSSSLRRSGERKRSEIEEKARHQVSHRRSSMGHTTSKTSTDCLDDSFETEIPLTGLGLRRMTPSSTSDLRSEGVRRGTTSSTNDLRNEGIRHGTSSSSTNESGGMRRGTSSKSNDLRSEGRRTTNRRNDRLSLSLHGGIRPRTSSSTQNTGIVEPNSNDEADHSPAPQAPSSNRRLSRRSTRDGTIAVNPDRNQTPLDQGTETPLAQLDHRDPRNDSVASGGHGSSAQQAQSNHASRRSTQRNESLSVSLHRQRSRSTNPGRRPAARDPLSRSSHGGNHPRSSSTNPARRSRLLNSLPLSAKASEDMDDFNRSLPSRAMSDGSVDILHGNPRTINAGSATGRVTDLRGRESRADDNEEVRGAEKEIHFTPSRGKQGGSEAEETEDEGEVLSRNLRQIASMDHKPSSARRLRPTTGAQSRMCSKSTDRRRPQRPKTPA